MQKLSFRRVHVGPKVMRRDTHEETHPGSVRAEREGRDSISQRPITRHVLRTVELADAHKENPFQVARGRLVWTEVIKDLRRD